MEGRYGRRDVGRRPEGHRGPAAVNRRSVTVGVILSAGLAVSAGCHPAVVPRTAPASSTSSAVDGAAPAAPALGDRVALGRADGSVRLLAVEGDVDAGRLFGPPRGERYFAVQVEGCAGPTETAVSFRPEYFTVVLADHTVRDAGPGMKKPDLHGDRIPPGRCLDGWVTFAAPRRQAVIAVVYDGSEQVRWSLPGQPDH